MMKFLSACTFYNKNLTNTGNTLVPENTSRVSSWLVPIAYFLGRYFVIPAYFGNIKITGQEYLPTDGPVIFAPTHRSRWDSLLLPYAAGRHVTGRDMRFMVTINECKGLQGWLVRHLGGFAVNIDRPAIATLRHVLDLMQQKQMLVIYPEGGIFRDGKIHTLKPGISRLALTAESNYPGLGIKIIPVAIQYSQPYPNWGTNINIHISEHIDVVNYLEGNLKSQAKKLTADLTNELQKLTYQQSENNPHILAEIRS
ncbi:1-acyl-sn-glycerol-3-phosphate acyltransferase [Anabaena sp. FACHB-1237]|uniref:lysophospholipid acyltransferase family protein n=1 Tax=Anabaena sp. FACHB-1237 TaxID=2692769 RepID=UPI001680AABF|nr:1-acyl-sn-glycerol-3-phosphate acyltransferase [Anabaena sp. FACHB-1237]MBD2138867.1 1-acyl-sn-glycerol-3-phosphate acyltransferase [Anabaena sp. FACHB-1237]